MSIAEFKNEPFLDFSDPKIYKKQAGAIENIGKQFGGTYELVIGGKKIKSRKKFNSYNPSNKEEVIGKFYKASKQLAGRAVKESAKKFEEWKKVSPKERASILFKAAKLIRKKRYEINAWLISEAGKNYAEADGEIAEAIDFLNFYGKEMLRYSQKQPITKLAGERNELFYIPIGSVTVIPPWNFPFAILAGMTSAALVAGNTVVLKPSSDTPMMGKIFYDIMEEAGLPAGVLNFVPGSGGEVGDTLVGHPLTRAVAFTGSVDVGKHINELTAKVNKGQIWIKRTILEMGGKDAVIVDNETYLDEAVKGVVASAFGFQGQKCSAGSRAIVDKKIYNKFVEKLKAEVEEIKVGDAKENYALGPVASESAERSIMNYIKIGRKEGKLLTGGNKIDGPGYYIEPTVFIDVMPNARIAQEEIFGPVLSVIKAENFDDALNIANGTIYGLTGSVYSKNKRKLARARNEFFAGNLYFNRKSTGALVGVHPFGGFNMSGTDSKAGGRDYLLLFMQAKLVSEKK